MHLETIEQKKASKLAVLSGSYISTTVNACILMVYICFELHLKQKVLEKENPACDVLSCHY